MKLAVALEQANRAFGPPRRPGLASGYGWSLPNGRFLAIFDLDGKGDATATLYADDKFGPLLAVLDAEAFAGCDDLAAWANAPYEGD